MIRPRYPRESHKSRWTEDEFAALKSAAEAWQGGEKDGKARKQAQQICEDFYRLVNERMRSPRALYMMARKLECGFSPEVNTALQVIGPQNTPAKKKAPPPRGLAAAAPRGESDERSPEEGRGDRQDPLRGARRRHWGQDACGGSLRDPGGAP